MKKMGSRDFQREMPEIFRSFKQIRAWRTARGEREAVQLSGEAEERIEEGKLSIIITIDSFSSKIFSINYLFSNKIFSILSNTSNKA